MVKPIPLNKCLECKKTCYYDLYHETLCKECNLKLLKGELNTMNKTKPESKIMADFLNNIRAEQDKQAKAIDDLIKLWDSQQVFNEMLHDKIDKQDKWINKLEVTQIAYELNYNKNIEELHNKIKELKKQVEILAKYISPF